MFSWFSHDTSQAHPSSVTTQPQLQFPHQRSYHQVILISAPSEIYCILQQYGKGPLWYTRVSEALRVGQHVTWPDRSGAYGYSNLHPRFYLAFAPTTTQVYVKSASSLQLSGLMYQKPPQHLSMTYFTPNLWISSGTGRTIPPVAN